MPKYRRVQDLFSKKNLISTFIFFLVPFFLILLGDGILTYVFPIVLESHVNSNFLTGLIMSMSSVIGILCDFLIPLLFSKYTWRFQLIAGIVIAMTFPIATQLGDTYSIIWMFILAVLMWGIYFEFLMFTQQSFVVQEEKPNLYSHDWGIIEFLTDAVEIIAPVIGAFLLIKGVFACTSVTLMVEAIALIFALILVFTRKNTPETVKIRSKLREYVDFFKEIKYWTILTKKVYLVLIMAIVVEISFATFQTFAGLYGQELIKNPDLNWLVLECSTLPSLLGALFISRLNISHGKKRLSQVAIFLSGLILASLFFFEGRIVPILIIIFVSNLIISVCWPLDDAIFSDLQRRLKNKDIHLIGLSQASYSVAYIFAPSIMGFVADRVGYNSTFGILGVVTAIIAVILIFITPKKIRLPQKELQNT